LPGQLRRASSASTTLGDVDVAAAGELGDEVSDQRGEVLEALPQRRQRQLDDVEAVQEVAAQRAVGDPRLDVLVGGGDHPQVDGHGAVAAEDVDDVLLQHAQQLGLERERELDDLVEEEGAAGGLTEAAGAVAQGAGEGAAHVAEQLRLEQLARDGRAIDGDEGAVGAAAAGVDPSRDQLLAGAALAGDQDRGGAGGDAVGDLERAGHRRRTVDDRPLDARDLTSQQLDLQAHAPALERLVHGQQQVVAVERLAEEVEGAGLHRRDREVDVPVGGDHQDGGRGGSLFDPTQDLQAAHPRHLHVGDDQGVALGREAGQPGLAVGGPLDPIAGLAQVVEPELAAGVVVLDEQDRLGGHARGHGSAAGAKRFRLVASSRARRLRARAARM
jgi:hypothetical protein